MTDTVRSPAAGAQPDGRRLPRLFPDAERPSLATHLARYGSLPRRGGDLISDVEQAGLRGRGGAGFPTAVKMKAVASRRGRSVVVANGTEGEPASNKDKTLLSLAPHLVLDGATLAAEAVGARSIILCVERNRLETSATLAEAIGERRKAGIERVEVRLEAAPDRYVAGEESALIHWLNGGEAKPTFVPPRPFEKGVGGRPTLVDNVETLAHVGLIGRYGAPWFRALGTADDPGTTLLTVSGAVAHPGVYEVAAGSSLMAVLEGAGAPSELPPAVLIGGYFGTWVPGGAITELSLGTDSLRRAGSSLGCGVVFALPHEACGLQESARVTRWLAGENAGQCGPCVYGLDALAGVMEALVVGGRGARTASERVQTLIGEIAGRGACKHPDGAVRFIQSSLRVFAAEVARHGEHGPCGATVGHLPTPAPGAWR
jgi:NADH:ubiquinone oxidoreductase subunit F (NADH-binding)